MCSRTKTIHDKSPWLSTESFGLLLMMVSAALFSAMGCFVKLAAATGLPSTELVFLRAMFQGCFVVLPAMIYCKDDNERSIIHRPFGDATIRNVVIARGMVGGFGFCCFYYAISALPLGDALALLCMNPVVTVLAAAAFLGESMQPMHLGAAVGSAVGAIFITRPAFLFGGHVDTVNKVGYVVAVLGTCCSAAVFCLMRRAGKSGAHTLQLVFSWAVFGILFSSCLGIPSRQWHLPPSATSWAYVFGLAAFGSAAHLILNYAGRIAPAGLSSIARSSEILWGYAWEVIIFSQVPDAFTLLGVVLIFASIFAVAAQKVAHDKNNKAEQRSLIQIIEENEEITLQVELHQDYGTATPLDQSKS